MRRNNVIKTFCCDCGKKLGQGCRDGKKNGYGEQDKRRFHKTCLDKQNDRYWNHQEYIYDEDKKNYYDFKQHYNYINKAYKKTATNDITRKKEYDDHMTAKRIAEQKQREFDLKYGFI
tara:strand:- start:4 stop:357 length:354 start_codon:yes stop_codon:yes gene_type:complete